jgi:hypothetical protein
MMDVEDAMMTMERTLMLSAVLFAAVACNRAEATTSTAVVSTTGPMEGHDSAAMRTIKITVGEDGFSPSTVHVKKGEHVMLEFTRVSDKTCATEVVFPELNLKKDLPLNKPVQVHIPTDQARTLTYQCGMGMYKSTISVD